MKDFIEFLAVIGICTVIAIFFTGLYVAGANVLKEIGCEQRHKITGFEHKYSLFTGCMIKPDGQWIKEENYIINKPETDK